jgi:hypothetical protein
MMTITLHLHLALIVGWLVLVSWLVSVRYICYLP